MFPHLCIKNGFVGKLLLFAEKALRGFKLNLIFKLKRNFSHMTEIDFVKNVPDHLLNSTLFQDLHNFSDHISKTNDWNFI